MIRLGIVDDIDTITTLYKETIGTSSMVKLYMRKNILTNQVYIKDVDNNIAGAYIYQISKFSNPYTFSKIPYEVFWLEQIMVFKEHQGKGIGKELLLHYFNTGLNNNINQFMLVCKKELISYYEKFEFKIVETGMQKRHNEEYYVMKRTN